jgi:hypothetical protein
MIWLIDLLRACAYAKHGYHGPMLMLEWVLVLLLAAVVLTNLAERLAVPYPSLLAIAGAGLAFLPFARKSESSPTLHWRCSWLRRFSTLRSPRRRAVCATMPFRLLQWRWSQSC